MLAQTHLPFKLKKSNEDLTPHAGLVVADEFNRGAGLARLLDRHLPRPGSNRGYKPAEWIRPVVLVLQGGGDNLTDIKMIAEDKALRSLCGLRRIPSESTLGDLLRRAGSDRHTMNGLGEVLRELTRVMLSEGNRTAFTLDVDATIIPADKFDAATAYNGTKGYQPMFGFLAENRWLIYDDFRNGNESPAAGIVQAIRTSQERMPEGTRGANFRSDSAAYNHHVTDYCEAAGIHFAIGADWTHATTQLYNKQRRPFTPSTRAKAASG